MCKLYVIVRADLSPGQQAVQCCHAITDFAFEWPEIYREWYHTSNVLALLSVPDRPALKRLIERADLQGVSWSCFTEPDLHDEGTAVVLGPEGRKLVSSLPLALK
jgi:peptidyl-tRNA hydrolase